MIFVDTNVIMYAVGGPHPLKREARKFFEIAIDDPRLKPCTSAEVLQELLHAYVPVQRTSTLDAALALVESCIPTIWSVEEADVRAARSLVARFPALGARDLIHAAMCARRNVTEIKTFDRALAAAFGRQMPGRR
ncbi:MAG: type II toxin-antitoxin system VapC family toxin [Deltaproteobacteria bacterium]|nr:type II toxin-antitoxin system VapC family toxin [Deltaproteobacteria bacterium]